MSVEAPVAPAGAPGRSRRPLLIGAAAVVVIVVLAVVFWPRHHRHAATRLTLPAPKTVVSAGGRQLLTLLQQGEAVTFHATYDVVADPKVVGGTLNLEIWQAPPKAREDTVLTTGGHAVTTSSFTGAKAIQTCVRRDKGSWSCQSSGVNPNDIIASVAATVGGQGVTVTNSTIGGRQVQCFAVGSGTGALQLCATSKGIPVLIANSQVRYELATLSSSVASSALTPPA